MTEDNKNSVLAKTTAKLKKRANFLLKVDKRIKWMGAGMFCFALFSVLSFFPEFTERYYSRGIFIVSRYLYDYTLGLLPFSSTIWLNLIFFLFVLYKLYKYIHFNVSNKQVSIKNRLKYTALSAGSFLGKVSVVFFLGWGFNYYRVSVEDHLHIELKSLTPQDILIDANVARKECLEARKRITDLGSDETFNATYFPKHIEDEMRNNLNKVFAHMNYPTPGRVRCRVLKNDYWLRAIDYTGIYVSFYGEALVSSLVPDIFVPFFMAHEMAHGYGFFDEADANFFAYLACEQSDDPSIVYSGRLALLVYVYHEFGFLTFNFPTPIRRDLIKYGSFGSQEEYNRMILLVNAWRKKYPTRLDKNIMEYEGYKRYQRSDDPERLPDTY